MSGLMPVLWEQINYTRVSWLDVCCPHPCSRVFFPSIMSCYRIKAFCVVFISDFSVSFLYLLPNLWCFITATQSIFRNPTPKFPKIYPISVPAQSFFCHVSDYGGNIRYPVSVYWAHIIHHFLRSLSPTQLTILWGSYHHYLIVQIRN